MELSIKEPVTHIMDDWLDIADDQKPPPMMIFSSYYLSEDTKKILREQKVPYIGAANFGLFDGLQLT